MSALSPWLDLPDDVTEKILERLPLSDYVRFPAVCRRWRSIQTDHRRRHAPFPPPMLKLPWLIPSDPEEEEPEAVSCYSPFEDRSYRIPIHPHLVPFPSGWLLHTNAIVNPISGLVIPFPEPLPISRMEGGLTAAVSPPPDHAVSVFASSGELYFWRRGDGHWTRLMLPLQEQLSFPMAVAFGGKMYCVFWPHLDEPNATHLIVVDHMQMPPAIHLFVMASPPAGGFSARIRCMVESAGEVLLVRETCDQSFQRAGYQVFRPDLTRRKWTRVESIGDRLLILHDRNCVSSLAADVGLKGNHIYSASNYLMKGPWKAFDLRAGTLTDVAFPHGWPFENFARGMFMPSLC